MTEIITIITFTDITSLCIFVALIADKKETSCSFVMAWNEYKKLR